MVQTAIRRHVSPAATFCSVPLRSLQHCLLGAQAIAQGAPDRSDRDHHRHEPGRHARRPHAPRRQDPERREDHHDPDRRAEPHRRLLDGRGQLVLGKTGDENTVLSHRAADLHDADHAGPADGLRQAHADRHVHPGRSRLRWRSRIRRQELQGRSSTRPSSASAAQSRARRPARPTTSSPR